MSFDPDRDYMGDMRRYVDAATDGSGPYHPRVVASDVITRMRVEDPELLNGWLHVGAEHFVWQMILDRDRSRRSHTRHASPRREFANASASAAAGDYDPLRGFLNMPFSVEDGSRRRLRTLRGDDLRYVASNYQAIAHRNAMMSAFLTALARRIGDDTVEDHFTEEQLDKMFAGFK